MIRILIFFLIGMLVLFLVKLARLVMKYSSSNKKTIDDLKDLNSDMSKKRYDVEEAEFREIPPDEDKTK